MGIYHALPKALQKRANAEHESSLAGALRGYRTRRLPGVPKEKAVKLPKGQTLSEAILAERKSREY
jgi:hypothetical protein